LLVRALLLGLVALAGTTSPAGATRLWNNGTSITANSCDPGEVATGIGTDGALTCEPENQPVVNLDDYAACDGSDETTEIQAAIDAACATGPGGTLYVPADTCAFGSTLDLCTGLAIVGSDSTERFAYGTAQPHELSYSGTGTAFNAEALSGIRFAGLLLRASSGSFAGPLIDFDGVAPNFSAYLYLDRVYVVAATQAGAATSVLLSINDATDVRISDSAFARGGYHIFGRALSSNFSNVVQITNTAFYQAEVCSIQNPGDTWDVHGNKWQQQGASSDESFIFCHGAGICSEGVNFTGNMIVDQPASPTNAELTFCGAGFNISGNFIGGGGTQDGVLFDEACDGCSVQGNWFGFLDEGIKFSGTGPNSESVTILGNDYDTVTTEVGGTRPGRSIMQENTGGTIINEFADIWLNVDTNANSNAGALVIGSNAASTSATPQYYFYEGARAEFRRGNDLRLYDNGDDQYVEFTLGSVDVASNKTITIPNETGTLCTTGSVCTGYAPTNATYITKTAESGLSAEQSIGALSTGLLLNTVSAGTGTLSQYAGTSCTNQFPRSLNNSGAATCASVASADITDGTITTSDISGSAGITAAQTALTGGTAIDINTNALDFDPTELTGNRTWGDGSDASIAWTWNLSGTDPVLTLQSGAFNLTGAKLIGATGSGGDLTLNSTSNGTKGAIVLDDAVSLWPNVPDFAASEMSVVRFNADLDLDGNTLIHSVFRASPTVHIGQASSLLGGLSAMRGDMTILHDDATSSNLPFIQLFYAPVTMTTSVAVAAPTSYVMLDTFTKQGTGSITVPSGGTHDTIRAQPAFKAIAGATATWAEYYALDVRPSVGTDNSSSDGVSSTVTTMGAVKYTDVSFDSGTGTEAVTNQVVVDIPNIANASTINIGVRNADTTVYTPCTDDISGNTDYMVAKTQCTAINLTAGAARDFTAGTDQIADGYDGQILYLFFSGSNSVKFDDGDNVNLGAAGAATLSAGDTLTLLFSSTRGEWLELGRSDN
jgi:hypothetical protein